jgi:pyruvate carboxylase subunit B
MANGTYTVIVDGQQYNVQIVDGNASIQTTAPAAAAPVAASVAATSTSNANAICAELPGSVFKLVASVGDSVNAGDKIMILEAMKMEIDVVAPHNGKVTSIRVNINDKIEAGQVLAVVE